MTLHLGSPQLAAHGFKHGFSCRVGGVSAPPFDSLNLARNVGDAPAAVDENRRRFATSVGYLPEQLYEVSQVHGAEVLDASDSPLHPAAFRAQEADALVSHAAGRPVGVRVADCVAVLLACPVTGAVAAVHAGWRGTVAGVVQRAVELLVTRLGASRERLLAALFPHIGPQAFEVGPDVAEQIAASAPAQAGVIVFPRAGAKPHVNLAEALTAQLERAGVARARIDHVPGCTFGEPDRFFSFRRDGKASGRHLAVIVPRC